MSGASATSTARGPARSISPTALRSPGSTLKPFIYGLAFEDGLAHPETLIDDRPTSFGAYRPENFDDTFQGTVTVRHALQQSLNVPAVLLLEAVGPDRLVARMRNAGAAPVLPPEAAPGLAVGLGGVGVRLTDLARSISRSRAAARPCRSPGGRRGAARDARGAACSSRPPPGRSATSSIGSPPPDNAAGGRIAFKTGTSYGYRDAWAIGFDGAVDVAVWVGRPDGAAVPGLVGARQRRADPVRCLPARLGPARAARVRRRPASSSRGRSSCRRRCSASGRTGCPRSPTAGAGDAPLVIAFPPERRAHRAATGGDRRARSR